MRRGEIVYRDNIVFQDTGKLDLKITGHPTMTIIEDDEYSYFFLITSTRVKGARNRHRYISLKKTKMNGLKKNSFIDIAYVFKEKKRNIPPIGEVDTQTYSLLMVDFIKMIKEGKRIYTKEQWSVILRMLELSDYNFIKEEVKIFANTEQKRLKKEQRELEKEKKELICV